MVSEDITFCAKQDCKHKNCSRNQANIHNFNILHSFAMFPDCEHWDTKEKKDGK